MSIASPYFTLREAAAYARCHPRTIRRWLDGQRLTRYGVERKPLVRRDELEALLSGGGVAVAASAVRSDAKGDHDER